MKKQIIYFGILGLLIISVSSCELLHEVNEPDEPEIEYSPTWPLSGEYYVLYGVKGSDGTITYDEGFGYFPLYLYNTSENASDQIWVWDGGDFWDFKVKVDADPESKTFGNENDELENQSYPSKVIVQSGQIFLDQATTTGGNVSDSIYVEVLFDDDTPPYGNTYVLSGYRRTGFLEDEH